MGREATGHLGDGAPPFEVRQSFWGYVIRGNEGPPVTLQIAQGLVLALGSGLLAAGLILLATPATPASGGLSLMRLGSGSLLGAMALMLIWFATRGAVVELHVDLARGELREMVRHRVGRATMVGRHGFDPSASLHIHRDGSQDGPRALILHHRGSDRGLCIARGPESALLALRERLEHDLRRRGPDGRPKTDSRTA